MPASSKPTIGSRAAHWTAKRRLEGMASCLPTSFRRARSAGLGLGQPLTESMESGRESRNISRPRPNRSGGSRARVKGSSRSPWPGKSGRRCKTRALLRRTETWFAGLRSAPPFARYAGLALGTVRDPGYDNVCGRRAIGPARINNPSFVRESLPRYRISDTESLVITLE